jgi:hypothetical protein
MKLCNLRNILTELKFHEVKKIKKLLEKSREDNHKISMKLHKARGEKSLRLRLKSIFLFLWQGCYGNTREGRA